MEWLNQKVIQDHRDILCSGLFTHSNIRKAQLLTFYIWTENRKNETTIPFLQLAWTSFTIQVVLGGKPRLSYCSTINWDFLNIYYYFTSRLRVKLGSWWDVNAPSGAVWYYITDGINVRECTDFLVTATATAIYISAWSQQPMRVLLNVISRIGCEAGWGPGRDIYSHFNCK